MGWARLDDGWHDHPKVIAVGLEGAGLFAMCLTWAHKTRRTSRAPGVIPDAVISRFAGSKAGKLAALLCRSGLFDEHTPEGWPIHDFADYLPRYDPDQARAAGARGGRARAANAKQTATRTASEPPGETEAEVAAKPSTRASARRNPVPVPAEGLRPSADAAASGDLPGDANAGTLIADWINKCRRRPPERVIGQMSREIRLLLDQDFTPEDIRAGIDLWKTRDVHPSVLPSIINQIVNADPRAATTRASTTDSRVQAAFDLAAELEAEGMLEAPVVRQLPRGAA